MTVRGLHGRRTRWASPAWGSEGWWFALGSGRREDGGVALRVDAVDASGGGGPLQRPTAAVDLLYPPPAVVFHGVVALAQRRQIRQRGGAAVFPGEGVVELAAAG